MSMIDSTAAKKSRRGKYDALLKDLIYPWLSNLRDFLGVREWESRTIEFPELFAKRMDVLFQDGDEFHHIEFQTKNEPDMPMRMLEYHLRILATHQQLARPLPVARTAASQAIKPLLRQTVLYIGTEPLSMRDRLRTVAGNVDYRYELLDIRSFNARAPGLLASRDPKDWILGVLCMEAPDRNDWNNVAAKVRDARLPEIEWIRLATQFLLAAILRGVKKPQLKGYEVMFSTISVAGSDLLKSVFDYVYEDGIDYGALNHARESVERICRCTGVEVTPEDEERISFLNREELDKLAEDILRKRDLAACLDMVSPPEANESPAP